MYSTPKIGKRVIYSDPAEIGNGPYVRGEPRISMVLPSFAFIPVRTTTGWRWLGKVYWVYIVTPVYAGFDRVASRQYDLIPVHPHEYMTLVLNGDLEETYPRE